jgi:hypothetical protein
MPTGRRRGHEPGRRPGHARAPPGALGPPPAAPGSRHWCLGKDVRYGRAPSGEACGGPRFARPRHQRRVRRRSLPGVPQLHRLLEAHGPRAVDDRRGRHGGPCRGTPWSSATCSGEAARELLPCEAVRSGRFQADSRARPLRRRAPMMARPARVRMRNRKPWVLARRRLFGWKVRFTSGLQRSTAGHMGRGRRPPEHADGRAHRSPRRIDPPYVDRQGRVKPDAPTSAESNRPGPNPLPSHSSRRRRRRHAENTGDSCGQRLMPRVGVVSVAGSTRVTTTRSRPRTVSCFRRSGPSCRGRTGVSQTLHTLWTTVWTCRAEPYDRNRSVIAGSEHGQRETA